MLHDFSGGPNLQQAFELGCRTPLNEAMRQAVQNLAYAHLSDIERPTARLVRGDLPAF
ncbi:hypothetical protein PSH97_14570 [Pseudomonas cucumis]|uniref:Uncharacterized protein n=1 Tax=Pseudomonas cucumis TaxID=2954082 RepID=A0ABY9EQT6_9PSED|nr:hypothetical protein [Pseudomonas cucumis]WLG82371.1 hypothetical protein PSH97_14570 [Pseudomonas cucumis]